MSNDTYIPIDVEDLYEKLTEENFIGTLSLKDSWLIWKYSDHITIRVSINERPHEGYIETNYITQEKELCLTHWHPMDDEIYPDLAEINAGEIIWIMKKRKLMFEPYPVHVSRKTFESFSEKKKNKYYILS